MATRVFVGSSRASAEELSFALAPALTPGGVDTAPSFFRGFAVSPRVLAQGMLTLADIAATRYFQPTPTTMRDPVLSAHGDRLRAESFSACNGVYARLDLLAAGFDGGQIGRGTTNIDIGGKMRTALSRVAPDALLHTEIGHRGATVSSLDETVSERPVDMPDRWVRALGNVAEMHSALVPVLHAGAAAARDFVARLPSATAASTSGWLVSGPRGLRLGLDHLAALQGNSAVPTKARALRERLGLDTGT